MRIRRRGGRHDQIENARDEFGDSRRLLSQRGSAYATDPDVALQAMKSQVYSTGPNGEKASPASEVALTPEELAKVKDKHATAALVFHYGGNDWSNAQLAALKAQFATEGVDVVAVTDRASSRRSRSPTSKLLWQRSPTLSSPFR